MDYVRFVVLLLLVLLLQVVEVLEAFRACQVVPEPQTVDHLVLQLVQGGLQHAPVDGIAHLLDMLGGTQHNPGPLFMKNYAKVSGACRGSGLAERRARVLCSAPCAFMCLCSRCVVVLSGCTAGWQTLVTCVLHTALYHC